MQHGEKDAWHRGNYKQVNNAVEANGVNGTKQIVFRTTEPRLATQYAMIQLFEWYHSDKETIPLIKDALFVYAFLSIHPFQDGNGRLSRLLGSLLLLKNGYSWIQYVSFEHEIESRKSEY
jgi:Fic family protein